MFIPNAGRGRTTRLQKTDHFSILIKMIRGFLIFFILLDRYVLFTGVNPRPSKTTFFSL